MGPQLTTIETMEDSEEHEPHSAGREISLVVIWAIFRVGVFGGSMSGPTAD